MQINNISDPFFHAHLWLVMFQGKQQAVYGDAAQSTSSPGRPDRWTQIKKQTM